MKLILKNGKLLRRGGKLAVGQGCSCCGQCNPATCPNGDECQPPCTCVNGQCVACSGSCEAGEDCIDGCTCVNGQCVQVPVDCNVPCSVASGNYGDCPEGCGECLYAVSVWQGMVTVLAAPQPPCDPVPFSGLIRGFDAALQAAQQRANAVPQECVDAIRERNPHLPEGFDFRAAMASLALLPITCGENPFE